ncbi:hypothetical protein PPMP20_27240 [Paraburkholderia phymatum]|nr:hypothetical protein [Paraburkholderia phymatum]
MMLVLALTKEKLLPAYFFTDSKVIQSFIIAGANLTPGDSFQSTAAVFRFLGAERDSIALPLLTWIVVAGSMVGSIWGGRTSEIRLREILLFSMLSLMATIYMSTLSKDILVLGLLIIRKIARWMFGRAGTYLWCIIMAAYAYYFRGYWFLILAVYPFLIFVLSKIRRMWLMGLVVIGAIFVVTIVLYLKFGITADSFRNAVNEIRIDKGDVNARTMITPFMPGGGFLLGFINVCLTFATFIIPFPLLLKVSPYYWIIFLVIVSTQFAFWRKLRGDLHSNLFGKQTLDTSSLIIAVLIVQSFFEPDYGSYVRHLSPFYGLIFECILNRTNKT